MAETTNIQWAHSTFNCWIGCTKVGPGCDHCYAEVQDSRMRWEGKKHWGAGVPRYRTSESYWRQPLIWNRRATESGKPWRVFCASLADVFDNEVPAIWRHDLWKLILDTPHLSWLLVTKRIGNVEKMWPVMQDTAPPNVRLLITVCNQEEADRDIPKLLALNCKNGISYEPALGPVDWSPWLCDGIPTKEQIDGERGAHYLRHGAPRLDWVIVGGESGSKARPFVHRWGKDTVVQCRDAGIPVFVKQMGSNAINREGERHEYKDRAGADPAEWPESLRVREFPE